jgi:hypothetical protein
VPDETAPLRIARRAAELELWCDDHLAALGALQLGDLADPAVVRTIATRARDLADCAEKLEALRGDDDEVERAVLALREHLAAL